MVEIMWDQTGDREFETGVDHGVLYEPDAAGVYTKGVPWNGLQTVTESPSGAEANPQYADNMKYLNLKSAEEFGCTVEAFTYPDEFGKYNGEAQPSAGVYLGQQRRGTFGLSYRTLKGNDLEGTDYGYKLHLVWNCDAAPSEKAYATVNDSPEAITFSWELTTTKVAVGTIAGKKYAPVASMTIDSTKVSADALATLEGILYGTEATEARLPTPREVIEIFTTGTAAPAWSATTAYTTGQRVTLTTGEVVEATTAGTSDATEPVAPAAVGDTVTDGTVVWTRRS